MEKKNFEKIIARIPRRKPRNSITYMGNNKNNEKIKETIKKKWLYVERIAGNDVKVSDVGTYLSDLPRFEDDLFERVNSPQFWSRGVILR